jgi:hypothetical protein
MIRIASILLSLTLSTPATAGEHTVVDGPRGKKLDALLSRYAEYGSLGDGIRDLPAGWALTHFSPVIAPHSTRPRGEIIVKDAATE